MDKWLLPGEGNDLFGEVEVLREIVLAFFVNEVVEILPAEHELDESSILEGSHELPDMDVGNVGSLVRLSGEIFVNDDDSLLENVSVNDLFLSLRDLDHVVNNIRINI